MPHFLTIVNQFAWRIGKYALAAYAVACIAGYFALRNLRNGTVTEVLEDALASGGTASPNDNAWANANQFQWTGAFDVRCGAQTMRAYSWRHGRSPTYFLVYRSSAGRNIDFVSYFHGAVHLTTGSTMDAQMLPRHASDFIQSFSTKSLDELYARHVEAAEYLRKVGGFEPLPQPPLLTDRLPAAMREQYGFIQSLRLWPARTPIWYFWRRRRLHGLSIAELHRQGLVRVPPTTTG